MWLPTRSNHTEKRTGENGLVAVAIDSDKGSHYALKWAIENLLTRGQTIILIHVLHKPSSHSPGKHAHTHDINNAAASTHKHQLEKQTKDLFLSFRCFCTRKEIHIFEVVLDDLDIAKALTEYVSYAAIENMVLGAPSRHGFIRRFKVSDVPSSVSKGAPDFCTVYVISKGKISSVRNASRSAPHTSPLYEKIHDQDHNTASHASVHSRHASVHPGHASIHPGHTNSYSGGSILSGPASPHSGHAISLKEERTPYKLHYHTESKESIKSPFARRGGGFDEKLYREVSESGNDISFVSGGRPSIDRLSSSLYDTMDLDRTSRLSASSDRSSGSIRYGTKLMDNSSSETEGTDNSHWPGSITVACHWAPPVCYNIAWTWHTIKKISYIVFVHFQVSCNMIFLQAVELHRWRLEEEQRLEEARISEETALAMAERERLKCRRAIEAAEAAQRFAELEALKRMTAEMKARKETEEMRKAMDTLAHQDFRYRRYTIEEIEVATDYFAKSRKIGEGGYGPVYKCYLDHTPVAVKVLRPDAAQGRSQFQQEVEVLSCIRHPNMVLLLGACPEYGCLVYEYMANGSLEDRLFQIGNTPVLPWQLRFRIAAEIATGLLFLHQTKPEPLVHRDLKPGNILLDCNFVSKISDVGLARLVPPSVADNVTQYRMTSTAGTFCYIDPEYQQTGMLGIKSDIYSLGIMLLQLITSKPPMGLTHHVEQSIEKGKFAEMLDPAISDWPVEEALCLAKLALQCAELRRKDRPDLDHVILPELERLRALAEENMHPIMLGGSACPSPIHSQISMPQDVIQSGYDSAKSRSSISSLTGRQ